MKSSDNIMDTYSVLEEIGKGSGGTIYKAYHKRLHKMVVLKKINNPSSSTIQNRQEVDILKNLNHTYLPQVIDFFENGGDVLHGTWFADRIGCYLELCRSLSIV